MRSAIRWSKRLIVIGTRERRIIIHILVFLPTWAVAIICRWLLLLFLLLFFGNVQAEPTIEVWSR
jgi:hypothetical protein